jgi:hypothetical protein
MPAQWVSLALPCGSERGRLAGRQYLYPLSKVYGEATPSLCRRFSCVGLVYGAGRCARCGAMA